jgi:nucleoside-diphosphate-sugar epimerase
LITNQAVLDTIFIDMSNDVMRYKTLVTGASGFVGSFLVKVLEENSSFSVVASVRNKSQNTDPRFVEVGDMDGSTDYSRVVSGIDVVIHTAARAHIMDDTVAEPLTEYRITNVKGTLNLAQQSVAAGVKRFIFISSIKVNGESTTGRKPFSIECNSAPEDAYGLSKCEAEEGLRKLASESDMEVVIIRPPLVYGPGVKGNFFSLLKYSSGGMPLPLALVNNQRSMIYVGNLTDFIVRCIEHPAAANETFLVSDGDDISLRSLIINIRNAFGRSSRLLPIPVLLFNIVGVLLGKQAMLDRLVGDLQIDSSKARKLLSWIPPFTIKQGIAVTVNDYKNRGR